jgi:1-acyl-sn-glycerol-3-phosphate acyltransferase
LKQYPIPWGEVFALTTHVRHGTRYSVRRFTERSIANLTPDPVVSGLEELPPDPRFLLCANHYQRKGLWILLPCSVITVALQKRYSLPDPPVRWIVTANWPPWRVGPWPFPSPGDWLLPRVAHALWCYPVSFAGTRPELTARSYRALMKDAVSGDRPIGLFPEGVRGTALQPADPLPGVERLILLLAKREIPVVPCRISEKQDTLHVRFGPPIPPDTLECAAERAAELVMTRVRELS